MNKSELVDRVARRDGLEKKQPSRGRRGAPRGHGRDQGRQQGIALWVRHIHPDSRAARMGRNPQTGAPVKIAASKGVGFAGARVQVRVDSTARAARKKAAPAKKATAKKATAAACEERPRKKAAKSTKKR